nr:secretion protein [Flavobacterium sp. ASV13]
MTKFSTTGLIEGLLLTSIYTYPGENKEDYVLNIVTGNGEMKSFPLDSAENSFFSIYDQNHNLIYKGESEINKLEISKTISLENHPSGIYSLEITESGKTAAYQIKVVSKKIKAPELNEAVY